MVIEPSPESWAALRSERPASDGSLVTRVVRWDGQESAILIGVNAAGALHLLIPVPDTEVRRVIPDLNGLKVRLHLTDGGHYLGLSANPNHERVFTPFCREIIQAVFVDAREPWAAVDSIIRQWQAAWRQSRLHMTQNVQTGLAGELLILSRVIVPALGPGAVTTWSGPHKERHDFIAGTLHLEVKTTRGSRHEHEISRVDQLWIPEDRMLLLASVRLEQSIGGTITLATLLDELRGKIHHEPAMVDDLMTKMSLLGWDDEMRRSGELLLFNLSDATFYEVDATFPRLAEDFQAPSGVVAVKYTISLANLPSLDVAEVSDMLEAAYMVA